MANRELLGRWGEKRCEKFLKKKGYKVLARNYLCKTGEIDLIAADRDGTVVFVEVKTRANEKFSDAEAAITGAKKIRMGRAARYFLACNRIEERKLRFDVVAIVVDGASACQIRHYENAFVP